MTLRKLKTGKAQAEERKKSPLRAPPHLSPDARKIWRRVIVYLADNGTLNPIDAETIEAYCAAVVRHRRLTAELDAAALMTVDGKLHPLLRTVEATAATVKNLAHVLGLNPTARNRLPAAPPQKGKDKWDGILS